MARLPLFCAALLMVLGACAGSKPLTPAPVVVVPYVPQEVRRCASAPAVPRGDGTQKEVARYVSNLHRAHANCQGNLGTVDRILTQAEADVQ